MSVAWGKVAAVTDHAGPLVAADQWVVELLVARDADGAWVDAARRLVARSLLDCVEVVAREAERTGSRGQVRVS